MSQISVPEDVARSLRKLADLTEELARELFEVLKEEKASLSHGSVPRRVASRFQDTDSAGILDVVRTLLSMYRARQDLGVSTDSLVDDVLSSGIELSEEQRKQLKERLLEFLSIDSLMVTAKAFNVLSSHERILVKSQILTDVRPIFKDDDSGEAVAAVLVHMLKLTCRQDGENTDFFIALDTGDVRKLRAVLDRADKKAANLQALLEATKLSYLEVSSESPRT